MTFEVPKGQTLLTMPLPPEVEAIRRARDEEWQRAYVLIYDIVLKAYEAGEITLERACKTVRAALQGFEERPRQRALGEFLEAALATTPPKRGRGNKGVTSTIRALAVGLARLAHEREGLTYQRADFKEIEPQRYRQTAYEFAARVMQGLLMDWDLDVSLVTPRKIERWRQEMTVPD